MINSQNQIILDLYAYHKNQIAERVVVELQKLKYKDFLLSGDDSGLKNVWEEICVQVQDEYSIYWESYEDTIRNLIADEISKQPAVIRNLLNHVTTIDSAENEVDDSNNQMDDVFSFLLEKAGNFENERIRRYIEQDYDEEEDDDEEE